MKAWALYIADSFGNANPATLDLLKNSIGPFLDASIYTKVMKAMDDQIDQIKRDRISLSFNPVGVITDPLAVGTFMSPVTKLSKVSPANHRPRQSITRLLLT